MQVKAVKSMKNHVRLLRRYLPVGRGLGVSRTSRPLSALALRALTLALSALTLALTLVGAPAVADDLPPPPPPVEGSAQPPPPRAETPPPPVAPEPAQPPPPPVAKPVNAQDQAAPAKTPVTSNTPVTAKPSETTKPSVTAKPPVTARPSLTAQPPVPAKPAEPARPVVQRPLALLPDDPIAPQPHKVAELPKNSRHFIKGELANVGAIGLVPWENQIGAVLGIERIGAVYYASVTPQINYNTDIGDQPLDMSFGAPLRIQLLDTRPDVQWSQIGQFRKQDWNDWTSYAQIVRNITYGGKESHVYADINAFKASTLGHGALLRRYNPNLDLNHRQVSGELDAFGDYGGGEIYVNNVVQPRVMGGLLFVKPLSFIDRDDFMMRSFSIGGTLVADVDAPLRNRLDYSDLNGDGRRDNQLALNQTTYRPMYSAGKVLGYGLDSEIKLVDNEHADWKTYVDYSMLAAGLPTDDPKAFQFDNIPTKYVHSGGFTWGHLLRLNLGNDPVHVLRLRAEVRSYDANYLPGYFDVMYEVQRVLYRVRSVGGSGQSYQLALANGTKLQEVLGRTGGRILGGYFEASWKISEMFVAAAAMEFNDTTPDNNLFVHLEVPKYKSFQFLATWHRRNASSVNSLVSKFSAAENILIAKARYRVTDNFHINAEAITPFGIGPDALFQNFIDLNINAEFGFGYGSRK